MISQWNTFNVKQHYAVNEYCSDTVAVEECTVNNEADINEMKAQTVTLDNILYMHHFL